MQVYSQTPPTFSKFTGTVYKIPGNELKLGYGDHVFDNEILGQIELASLNVPRSKEDTAMFPGVFQKGQFGIVFLSTLKIAQTGCYKFSLISDDGSKLWIEDRLIISNDKPHKMTAKRDTMRLDAGLYDVKVWYYNAYPYEFGLILNGDFLPDSIECQVKNLSRNHDMPKLMMDNLLFDFNSSIITKEGKSGLDKYCVQLSKNHFSQLTVVGYSDNIGSKEYNIKLSLARAQAVLNYIKTRLDLKDVILNVEGKGSSNPISSDPSVEGQKINRRVEVLVQ
jgi:outer membrane protein OmpA-like peptidoglycan-associated protein